MHRRRDDVSLLIHREVAARLRTDHGLIAKATTNLERWQNRHGDGPLSVCYQEWIRILQSSSVEEVAALLAREGDQENQLRQNSPFAGVLRPKELWRLKKEACHEAS